jgi:hypothetical protein
MLSAMPEARPTRLCLIDLETTPAADPTVGWTLVVASGMPWSLRGTERRTCGGPRLVIRRLLATY